MKDLDFYKRAVVLISFLVTFLSFSNIVCGQTSSYLTSSGPYSYTLSKGARTSAGVYRPDSTLVRTLWTTVSTGPGTYQLQWDGKDDNGNPMAPGNYIVKVVANNVVYTWMGVIGNTSDSETGSTVHRGYYYCMGGMAITNGTAYYCTGYSEGFPSTQKMLLSKPQQKINILPYTATTACTEIVATDGTIVYWAGKDPYAQNNTWVFGTRVSDDSNVNFSNGIPYAQVRGLSYSSAINYINQASSVITGLAVQKTGNLLFVARAGLNQLSVLNKTTGQLLQTITVNSAKALGVDMNDNLWMVSGTNTVSKYQVAANGTLSAPLITISSLIQPVALAVSPDNTTIAIADAGITSQQVKAFSNSNGNPTWTLGTPGGYMQDATVTNNKFYFNDVRGAMYANGGPGFLTFIAYQPNGSFWVNDPGNYRVQHYAANGTFIETIMSLGASYSTWADKNDNTRVGAEYLEFKIDNTQPITGSTGWQLVKNWGATIPANYNKTMKFTSVITLNSGGVKRTYGCLRFGNNYDLVEFQSNNSLRFTGISRVHGNIDVDGSLLTDDLKRFAFLGFDNFNNPIWSKIPTPLTGMITSKRNSPYLIQWLINTYVTSSGKVLIYDYSIQTYNPTIYNTGFHLAAIQQGGSSYLWKTALATHLQYRGPYPDPSRFDIGNNVNNMAGSSLMVFNQNVITGYHGEFWKLSQTNMYNHYWDNGLAIGQFGTVGPCSVESPAMMAGNALSPQLVYGSSPDELYLYHGDESFHGGIHKWKITGLSTIAELDIPISYPAPAMVAPTLPGTNLMVNLPYNSPLSNNTAGWTVSPAGSQTGWTVNTNVLVSGVQNNPDIFITCKAASGNFSVDRDLGNNSGLLSWTVSGQISFYNTDQQGSMKQYMDVLDNKGKIIARLGNNFLFISNILGTSTNAIVGNNKTLASGLNASVITPLMWQLQPIDITAVNNQVTIKYAGYSVTTPIFDPTADITSPKTLRAYIAGGNNPTGRNFGFKDMRFISTKANQSINFNAIPGKSYGNPAFSLIAKSSANLPVTFTVISGPAMISGNMVTLTGVGNVTIQASQPGNSLYGAANPVTQTFNVVSQSISRVDH
ncbi:MAG TPA: FlgD immunoglobulin-like domain containing protein [Mucilaginibacter sp.]